MERKGSTNVKGVTDAGLSLSIDAKVTICNNVLMSVSQITKKGMRVIFEDWGMTQ